MWYCLRMACSSKRLFNDRGKLSKIWAPGDILVRHIWMGYLSPFGQSKFETFGALFWLLTQKRLVAERDRRNLYLEDANNTCIAFDLVIVKIIWGSLSARISKLALRNICGNLLSY